MKRYLFLFISIICLTVTAQEKNNHQQRRPWMTHEEFRAKQQKYIADYANLSESESKAFFPLYFELQDKKHAANHRVWKQARAVSPRQCTEEECDRMIDSLADVKIECATLEKEYLKKFKEILPAKKLMHVQMAEDRFQRELLRGMQRGGTKNKSDN